MTKEQTSMIKITHTDGTCCYLAADQVAKIKDMQDFSIIKLKDGSFMNCTMSAKALADVCDKNPNFFASVQDKLMGIALKLGITLFDLVDPLGNLDLLDREVGRLKNDNAMLKNQFNEQTREKILLTDELIKLKRSHDASSLPLLSQDYKMARLKEQDLAEKRWYGQLEAKAKKLKDGER